MRLVYLFSIYRCFCSLYLQSCLWILFYVKHAQQQKSEKSDKGIESLPQTLIFYLCLCNPMSWTFEISILYLWSNSLSLKWQRFVPSDCKDMGFKNLRKKLSSFVLNMSNKDRKSELAGSRTELLNQSVQSSKMNLCLIGFCHFNAQQINIQDKYLY